MRSSSSNDHGTSHSSDANRAPYDDPQRQRGVAPLPAPDNAPALTVLPSLKPIQTPIVRYHGNHGGDLWTETRYTSQGVLRKDFHQSPPPTEDKTSEKVTFFIYTSIFFYISSITTTIFIIFYYDHTHSQHAFDTQICHL